MRRSMLSVGTMAMAAVLAVPAAQALPGAELRRPAWGWMSACSLASERTDSTDPDMAYLYTGICASLRYDEYDGVKTITSRHLDVNRWTCASDELGNSSSQCRWLDSPLSAVGSANSTFFMVDFDGGTASVHYPASCSVDLEWTATGPTRTDVPYFPDHDLDVSTRQAWAEVWLETTRSRPADVVGGSTCDWMPSGPFTSAFYEDREERPRVTATTGL